MKKLTQKERVLSDLQANSGKWLPTYYWLDQYPRIMRAGAHVHDLRKEGHNIQTKHEGNIYYYRLIEDKQPELWN